MFKFLKDRKKKDNKGFTLVELVIVIAILAILVGLLAPQYTKYVEKSRKTADASNMDEMVKVVKVYAADPANELAAGSYTIKISNAKGTKTTITAAGLNGTIPDKTGLEKEMGESIPKWEDTVTKSQKWGENGASEPIEATVTVNTDGGTSVTYPSTEAFKAFMESAGSAKTVDQNNEKPGEDGTGGQGSGSDEETKDKN